MKSFAIVLVCYNRLSGMKRLLKSLEQADYGNRKDIQLIFSIDNSGKKDVEEYAASYYWPYGEKRIRIFPVRQGLKNHVFQCGDFTLEYDIVVILEDDILVSDSFYHYAYQAAEAYWNVDNIAGISLYSFQKNWLRWVLRFEPMKTGYDTFFMRIAQSWGQVWTYSKWSQFMIWYHQNENFKHSDIIPQYLNNWPDSSWLKYHDRYCIETKRYFVYPYYSLSTNFSDVGEHSNQASNDYQTELQYKKKSYLMATFDDTSVKYDEYMNRVGLEKCLGLSENQLEVDLYGTRPKRTGSRYLLTTDKLNKKIEKTYALSVRPIEAAVLLNLSGNGIYLYDTTINRKNRASSDAFYNLMSYELRTHDWRAIIKYALSVLYLMVKSHMKEFLLPKQKKRKHNKEQDKLGKEIL